MFSEIKQSSITLLFLGAFLVGFAFWFNVSIRAAEMPGGKIIFSLRDGEGFKDVADELERAHAVRSALAAKIYFVFSGAARRLQPGKYLLVSGVSTGEIARILSGGARQEMKVTIPEGSSIYDIDEILSKNYVVKSGEFLSYINQSTTTLEGRLFPDTYKFFIESAPSEVARKMLSNFDLKAKPLLPGDEAKANDTLVLASILEKEVRTPEDQRMAAGILLKRLKVGMPLQVDAAICYIKRQRGGDSCYPLTSVDFQVKSPYNTYLNKGLPPHPIGNPGQSAIAAALDPTRSAYWFYLSDPATGKTIWSESLDKHSGNRVQYLQK